MRLWLANETRQRQVFAYRLPGVAQPFMCEIPVGTQKALPHDLDQAQLEFILKKNSRYGLVKHDDVQRNRKFVSLSYNIDKPVPPKVVRQALITNNDVLKAKGRENRQLAALGVNQMLEDQLKQQPGLATLENLEMEITEEEKPGQVEDRVQETLNVSSHANKEEHGKVLEGKAARSKKRERTERA